MDNLVLHIVLPKCLRLKDGRTMGKDTTLSVIGSIVPFYASIAQVRLAGGSNLNRLSDLTIACKIYEASKDADSLSYNTVEPAAPNTESWKRWQLWANARQSYVVAISAKEILTAIYDLLGSRTSKTLANFSVNKVSIVRDEGTLKLITDLLNEANRWLMTLKSGGEIGPGGSPKGKLSTRGGQDPDNFPAGRLWAVTGLGANASSAALPGSSYGKPIKFASAPITSWQSQRYVTPHVIRPRGLGV